MSDTTRWAIEYGPDEPETYPCESCGGTRFAYNGPLSSRKGPCRECDGRGVIEIDPDMWEDTRDHERDETLLYDDIDFGEGHYA